VLANILVDPAGTRPIPLGALKFLTLPMLGELGLGLFASEQLVRNIASDFFEPALVQEFQERYRPQMHLAGFRRSILSTLRNGMLGDFSETYAALGRLRKPALLLWGREDRTVPFADSTELLKLLPHSEFHVIEHTSHIPHYEKPGEVNPLLLRFLENLQSD
jgi:pimeloyl-ACP methyl ester carboxylesterase